MRKEILRIIAVKFSLLIIVMALFFSPISKYYFKFMFEYVDWNQIKTIKKNGRIATVIFLNQKEALNKDKLSNYKNIKSQVNHNLFPGTVKYQKNIYYIVLESFFDPRRLENVTYDPDPIHPDFSELLTLKTQFLTVISPIYGGGTAQAEFELLTGVPALSKIGSCEFNILKEKRTSGFLSKLVSVGYSATAIIASDSKYYNSRTAYTSLGFEKIVFLANEKSVNEEGKMIFDGDLLVYTYNHLAPDTPRFTYILGMYGHFPYERNKKKRPDVIKTSSNDERIVNISNQFYYRTKALADFVKKIQVDDPNSIIYITSDHLPPIMEKKDSFESIKYNNDSVLFVNGRQVDVSENPLFKISWIIWDELTGEKIQRNCDLEDLYFQVLSESLL